tara:strand:- start:1211 stop:1960 length:750 start_codon:yes stop_codon:yes gene_type:complete
MKKVLFFFLIGVSLLIQSCGKDDVARDLTINIKLENKGVPMVGFEPFDYPGGYSMFLTKFSLFISEMELIGEDNSSLPIGDILFMDLLESVQTLERAEQGLSLLVSNVPSEEFTQLRFNVGVPSELNAQQPSDFTGNNALSNTGEYWVGWSSYIFHKTEGKIDTDGDGEFETNVALHIGSDEALRVAEYDINLNLDDRQELRIVVDIDNIFNINGAYYDFIETPQIHHLGLLPKALPIMDAFSTNISVE